MYVFNTGSTETSTLTIADRYLQLAHPDVANVLQLQWMADDNSYQPPTLTGLLTVDGRAANSSLVVIKSTVNKLQWPNLAFVVTPAQAELFEQLVTAQSATSPVSVFDNMWLTGITRLVAVLADNYLSPYVGMSQFVIQFSLQEV